jgi:hypothetical protein
MQIILNILNIWYIDFSNSDLRMNRLFAIMNDVGAKTYNIK